MTLTLNVELPDELEQQILAQAQQQQVSPEQIIVQSLTHTFSPPDPEQNQQILATSVIIAEMMGQIRTAKQAGQTCTEFPAMPLTRHLANVLIDGGLINQFEQVGEAPNQWLKLMWNLDGSEEELPQTDQNSQAQIQQTSSSPLATNDISLNLQNLNLPPKLQTAFQNVDSPNAHDRVQALLAIRELYSEAE